MSTIDEVLGKHVIFLEREQIKSTWFRLIARRFYQEGMLFAAN